MTVQLFGLPVARGVAIGKAVLIASGRVDVAHYFVAPELLQAEVDRLRVARNRVADELLSMKQELPDDVPPELAALLDVHLMLLHDQALADATRQWIEERHYNAEWALAAQLEVLGRQFDEMEDEYLRDRKADLEQVGERVLSALIGTSAWDKIKAPAVQRDLAGEDPLILVANDVAPADMLQFKRSVFVGFVTDVGGHNSHTAIVARSLQIPAVVGARDASHLVRQDDWVVIDGDAGVVIVDPPPIVLEEYRFRQRQSQLDRQRLTRLRHTPAVTMDGQRVELLANIELPDDAVAARDAGAAGVGLFRSEFLFMNRDGHLPDEDEQFEAYRAAVQAMEGMPVTIRTVDIGADKPLDRLSMSELRHEHLLNPALGLRAIRWCLSEPSMFRRQLRAILRASVYGDVRLLIPMLSQVNEIRQTLDAIARAQQQLTEAGQPFRKVPLGAMIEVPAAAMILPAFLRHFDFVSLGTNDLIQYTLAIDRADQAVAHLYDPWHPAVLTMVQQTILQSRAAGRPASVCGEMAGDRDFTELLLGFGLRSFSMHPSRIPDVKQVVLRADTQRLEEPARLALEADEPHRYFRALLAERGRA
jgi:phosphoenolpyruvate-protein phosphotransferase (PTS system enzyme I)